MTTGLIYSERFLEHDTGPGHPERADRLRAIVGALEERGLWERLRPLPFEPAPLHVIEWLHKPAYVDRVFAACREGQSWVDSADSAICPTSAEVAQLAVGGAIAAVDAVMRGEVRNAFAALRPPGHHAEAGLSMGFCLFGNVALAAEHLIRVHGLERVAIVDWDVHHGNGTQHMFDERGDMLFISLHESPLYQYPGTGHASETGTAGTPGEGHTVNIPLQPGAGDLSFRHAFEDVVLPKLEAYRPQFLLVSAGFDASAEDPLGHLEATPEGFAWMTRQLLGVAAKHCGGRFVSLLEGGYDLRSLGACVCAHVGAMLEG